MNDSKNPGAERAAKLPTDYTRKLEGELKEACAELEKAMLRSDLRKPVQASFSCVLLWEPYMPKELFASIRAAAEKSELYSEVYGRVAPLALKKAAQARYKEACEGCGGTCGCDGNCSGCSCGEAKESASETRKDKGFSDALASAVVAASVGQWEELTNLASSCQSRTASEVGSGSDASSGFFRVANLYAPGSRFFRDGDYFLKKISSWVQIAGDGSESGGDDLVDQIVFFYDALSEVLSDPYRKRELSDIPAMTRRFELLGRLLRNNFKTVQSHVGDLNWVRGVQLILKSVGDELGLEYQYLPRADMSEVQKSAGVDSDSESEELVSLLYFISNQGSQYYFKGMSNPGQTPKSELVEVRDLSSRLYNFALDVERTKSLDSVDFDELDAILDRLEILGVPTSRNLAKKSYVEEYTELLDVLHERALKNSSSKRVASDLREIRQRVVEGTSGDADLDRVASLMEELNTLST